jgi:hypothetical protein
MALTCNSNGAIITLPPTQRTLPKFLTSDGLPSGPVTLSIHSPWFSKPSAFVVLPTSWKTNDTVPFAVSYPEIVRGIRSPALPFITIRNCPACDLAAISGASTSNSFIFGASSFLVTILYVLLSPPQLFRVWVTLKSFCKKRQVSG